MGALVGGLVMGLMSEEAAVAFVPDLCGNARRRFLRPREIRLSGTFDGPRHSGGILHKLSRHPRSVITHFKPLHARRPMNFKGCGPPITPSLLQPCAHL